MFVSVLRIAVKLKLIWQPYGLLIHSKAPAAPSSPVLSGYHTSSLSPLLFCLRLCDPVIILSFTSFYTLRYCFVSAHRLSSPHCFLWSRSSHQLSLVIHVIRWYVLMADFLGASFMCASCVAMAGMGCSSRKSICHMSKICWVRRFMSRFCGSFSVFSLITISVYSKWPQRSTAVIYLQEKKNTSMGNNFFFKLGPTLLEHRADMLPELPFDFKLNARPT